MEITGAGVIKHVFGNVGNSIIQTVVVQYALVGSGSNKRLVESRLVNEIVVVEVALVDGEHVYKHESGKNRERDLAFQFAFAVEENRHGRKEDEDQAPEGVFAENGHTHVFQLCGKGLVQSSVLA